MKFLLLVAFLLCGCSQTTVHLYSRYLSAAQIEEINKELVKADLGSEPTHFYDQSTIKQVGWDLM
ncbi:hypothetical protein [Paraglaciecola arctica]|uniref:Uncharacterized protein n=1 Tax=Paraglaciecola arctica BSs20135 TaxID=493475 RepID=K6XCL3_9ALTE|nr:hypothetical protein [Paraglaciecola arctica]GAC18364.1 hypothetical protein GARC_1389 [Paraglaciecola arctica BSs20135]